MNGHGGRRSGAGRKPGGENVRSRVVLHPSIQEQIGPVEVQTRTMLELWRRAHNGDGEMVDLGLATQACAIARDVAPYLHPRLAAIAATATVTTVERSSPEEARQLAMAALEKAFGSQPRQITLSPATTGDIGIPVEVGVDLPQPLSRKPVGQQ